MSEATQQLLKKISVRTLGCDASVAADKDLKGDLPLCVIHGKATGTKGGENRTTGDPWTALTGKFEGVNIQPGDYIRTPAVSKVCFLPGGIQDMIEEALIAGGEDAQVSFAVRISARYSPNAATKYVYVVENIAPPQQTDDLSETRNAARAFLSPATLPQLPAPETAAAPEQPAKPTKKK